MCVCIYCTCLGNSKKSELVGEKMHLQNELVEALVDTLTYVTKRSI